MVNEAVVGPTVMGGGLQDSGHGYLVAIDAVGLLQKWSYSTSKSIIKYMDIYRNTSPHGNLERRIRTRDETEIQEITTRGSCLVT